MGEIPCCMHIFPPNQPLPSQQEPLQKRRSSMKVSRPVASYFTYTLGKTKDLYVPLTSRCSSKTLVETRGPNFMLPSSVVASLCRVRDVEHDTQQWKHWCFYLDSQDGPQKVPPSLPPVAELPPLTSPRENDRQQQHEQQQQPPKRLPCIHDLRMEIEDYIRINDTVDYSVIFSGEGEPTLRLDDLIALVESLQKASSSPSFQLPPFRITTNGLILNGQQTARRLKQVGIDQLSIALMTSDPQQYQELMTPATMETEKTRNHHAIVCQFIQQALEEGLQVETTGIDRNDVDKAATEALAKSLHVTKPFRWRPYFG